MAAAYEGIPNNIKAQPGFRKELRYDNRDLNLATIADLHLKGDLMPSKLSNPYNHDLGELILSIQSLSETIGDKLLPKEGSTVKKSLLNLIASLNGVRE